MARPTTGNVTPIHLNDEQALALHDVMIRIGAAAVMRRVKEKAAGVIRPPNAQENALHEVTRQLAIPVSRIRARENSL